MTFAAFCVTCAIAISAASVAFLAAFSATTAAEAAWTASASVAATIDAAVGIYRPICLKTEAKDGPTATNRFSIAAIRAASSEGC